MRDSASIGTPGTVTQVPDVASNPDNRGRRPFSPFPFIRLEPPMPQLPDPRTPVSRAAPHELADRIEAVLTASAAGDGGRAEAGLARLLRRAFERGDDAGIAAVAPGLGDAAARLVDRALDAAIHGAEDNAGGLIARVFLIPVVFVTAGRAPAEVQGALPEVAAIAGLMRRAGALGAVENFGLGNALGSLEAARAVLPQQLFGLTRHWGEDGGASLLMPVPIAVTDAEERAHLRFLAGASLTAADAPTFLETAGTVGRWGIAVSGAIHDQLAVEGLSLLALPRAPMSWFRALSEGTFLREEVAFNLFVTGALRKIRAETGEPDVVVSSRDDGTVRVDMTSPFDPQIRHAYRWPLQPADDLSRVEASILDLLRDCRVDRVEVREQVLPAEDMPMPGAGGLLRH